MIKFTLKIFPLFLLLLLGVNLTSQTKFNVTFTVDMTNAVDFNPATDDVYISGSFADWPKPGDDTNYRMKPTIDNQMIYSITIEADSGQIQYKYFRVINGTPDWDHAEWIGEPNRTLILLLNNLTFTDTWGDKPCYVTFKVDMTDADPFDPITDKVAVMGDFAGWLTPGIIPELFLTPVGIASDIYFVTIIMYKGSYEYKYFRIINNVPSNENGEWGNSEPNRKLTVESDTTVNDIWGNIGAGIFDSKADFTYELFPNPVIDNLNISGIENVNNIEIYDLNGKLIRHLDVFSKEISIDIDQLQSGTYIVNFNSDTGIHSSKFVKE